MLLYAGSHAGYRITIDVECGNVARQDLKTGNVACHVELKILHPQTGLAFGWGQQYPQIGTVIGPRDALYVTAGVDHLHLADTTAGSIGIMRQIDLYRVRYGRSAERHHKVISTLE